MGDATGVEALPPEAVKLAEDRLMEWIGANGNHLAMYLTANRADMMNKKEVTEE